MNHSQTLDHLRRIADDLALREFDVQAEELQEIAAALVRPSTPGLCRDCRHWRPYADEDTVPWPTEGLYPQPPRGWGFCHLAEMRDARPMVESTLAFGYDGEKYVGGLQTAPEFGCVQFEARLGSG